MATVAEHTEALGPPRSETGWIGWARHNLFGSWGSSIVTIVSIPLALWACWAGLSWLFTTSDWTLVTSRPQQYLIGVYPTEHAWRPLVGWLMTSVLFGLAAGMWRGAAERIAIGYGAIALVVGLLPYGMMHEGVNMPLDIRLLVLGNLPVLAVAYWLGTTEREGRTRWLVVTGLATCAVLNLLLFVGVDIPRMVGLAIRPLGLLILLILFNLPIFAVWYGLWATEIEGRARWLAVGGLPAYVLFLPLVFGQDIRPLSLGSLLVLAVSYGLANTEREGWPRRLVVGGIATHVLLNLLVVVLLSSGAAEPAPPTPLDATPGAWAVLMINLILSASAVAVSFPIALPLARKVGRPRSIVIGGLLAYFLTLLLLAGLPGLMEPVSPRVWGGLMLNLILSVSGIVLAFPIGVALALGRRSNLPVVKLLCVVFIEVFRGVPLITLLFVSQVLVPLALPENFPVDSVTRAAIVITLFSSAYMAENIRGGLQGLPPGQAEAARALGLPGWQVTVLILLPQAIRNVIPAIVGQFIALFKDTSLVYIVGMLDILEIGRAIVQGNPEFIDNGRELYIFVAVIFWLITYTMSYASRSLEKHLGVGER